MRKFFKTTITLTVLSEVAPVPENLDLREVLEECESGGWSGQSVRSSEELTATQMASALKAQGSDPGLFDLDDDGTDLAD